MEVAGFLDPGKNAWNFQYRRGLAGAKANSVELRAPKGVSGQRWYQARRFPSLKRRGGRDINENIAKPPLKGADGVVRPAESSGLTISPNRPPRLRGTRWLRAFLLTAQPPLLFKEGNVPRLNSIGFSRRLCARLSGIVYRANVGKGLVPPAVLRGYLFPQCCHHRGRR